jgi:FixJ family two-component response regulator
MRSWDHRMKLQSSLNGKIVAVVDDHHAVLDGMRRFLESHGAEVLTYNDGSNFLRDLPSANCAVVDYYMPGLSGLDLAAELRRRAYSTPVILLSGMTSEIPKNWRDLGVSEVVDKLSGSDELLRMIHRHTN